MKSGRALRRFKDTQPSARAGTEEEEAAAVTQRPGDEVGGVDN